jgi:hypothetical protein
MEEQYILFSDHIGRTVVGKLVDQDDSVIKVTNPVIVHAEPNPQTNQIQVHTFPYLFMEFASKESRDSHVWTFAKSNVAVSDIQLDDRLMQTVKNVNSPAPPKQEEDAKVVSLFDDEDTE